MGWGFGKMVSWGFGYGADARDCTITKSPANQITKKTPSIANISEFPALIFAPYD